MIDFVVGEASTKQAELNLCVVDFPQKLANIIERFEFFFTKSVVKSLEPIGGPSSLTPALSTLSTSAGKDLEQRLITVVKALAMGTLHC